MDQIELVIEDLPPAKSEGKSMLAAAHRHHSRVVALLQAARDHVKATGHQGFGNVPMTLDVTLTSPEPPASDATNYLGGITDVLEAKGQRGPLGHLGELAKVALYDDDRQFQDVHFRWQQGKPTGYRVRIRPRA